HRRVPACLLLRPAAIGLACWSAETMKAMLSKSAGGPETLVLEEMPDPTPGAGEVLLAVKACGVNYPDLLIIEDRYQFKPPRPFAPGGEVAGTVAAVGPGGASLKAGDMEFGSTWAGRAVTRSWGDGRQAGDRRVQLLFDAGRYAFRHRQRLGFDLRHLTACPQGSGEDQAGRNAARAWCRRRHWPFGGRAWQGLRRPRHRRCLFRGEGGVGQKAWGRQRRGVRPPAGRPGGRPGGVRSVQAGLRT